DRRDTARGDPATPLSREEVASKFRGAAEAALGSTVTERVIGLVSHLEDVPQVDGLIQCLGHR
ncbi:MAG: hypothetical protein ACRDOU_04360, partial [Streptosporangiaceae bacterium]